MMPGSSILVRCDDGAVKTAIETWLTGLSLEAPAGLVLDVAITDDALPEVTDVVFEQPDVRFARGAGGRGLIVVWMEAPAVAVLPAADTTASIRLSSEAARQMDLCIRTFMMSVLIVLLRRVGWYHLHAATAIDPQGRGWLIAGNTHAGKSTTAALLAANGWRVGADDAAWLVRRDHRVVVHTTRAPIALREDGHRLLARDGGVQLTDRGKVGYTPEDLGGVWTPLVDPEVVIFTAVGTSSTSAHPLDRRSALAELVRWSAWVVLEPDLAQAHLDVLTSLTRQTRTFRVTLGRDLFAHPNRLIELIT
jgi:hypothetical protein